MAVPAWELFVALVTVIAIAVVGLARASASHLRMDDPLARPSGQPLPASGPGLLLNLSLTHLGVGAAVGSVVWLTGVPLEALGLVDLPDPVSVLLLSLALLVVNEGLSLGVQAFGVDEPELLRELLAPETLREWAILLGALLPAIAVAEELLFRGALIGGVAAATTISPWVLAAISSIGFGAAHTAQGDLGIVVAALLGFTLAAAFVVTGNLLLVVIAHYLVNATEFVLHEGLDVEWGR
ncbi:MAG: lysostaphin resistance A-like protein [Halodesulfurarchaeum sp.]